MYGNNVDFVNAVSLWGNTMTTWQPYKLVFSLYFDGDSYWSTAAWSM